MLDIYTAVRLFILTLLLLCGIIDAEEYPLIDELIVTKSSVTVIPGKNFREKYLYSGPHHFIEYFDPKIDLREFDESILVMPFIFDVLASILISGDTYYVNCLDSEICKSLERFRAAFKIMYPNTRWDGQLICGNEIEHIYHFDQNRIMNLFSGGVDSTYSLLANLDKTQVLFTQKGHVDSNSEKQWHETYKISRRFADLFHPHLTTAVSNGAYIADRGVGQKLSSDIYDWGIQAIGDLRWMGKVIPLMIHYKTSRLCIPASATWSYPIKSMSNAVIKNAFLFGDCIRVYTDGFDVSRTKKTEYITKYLMQTFPESTWTLKVCFDGSGKNCGKCRKCIRTINDLYSVNADPNRFGFQTSLAETKDNLMKCMDQINLEDKVHQEIEAYFFNELLKYIEQNEHSNNEKYISWLYHLLIKQNFIIDIRQRNSDYYRNLQVECEKAWENLGLSLPIL
jgi:hypothetical protein